MLMRGAGEWRVSAENQLPCVVTEIRDGAVQAEVRLRLLDTDAACIDKTLHTVLCYMIHNLHQARMQEWLATRQAD